MKWVALAAMVLAVQPAIASQDCTEDAIIVFDGSGSMSEMGFNRLDTPRIFEAREALHRIIPRIERLRRLGLTVYGPGAARDACENVTHHFPPVAGAGARILSVIDELAPAGPTPLTRAVAEAAEALDYTRRPATVVLVTDGKETCGGATCQLAAHLAHEGVDLTVHVIGFKVRAEHFDWGRGVNVGAETAASCLAETTGGQYVPAETVDDLVSALSLTLGCPVYGVSGAGQRKTPPG
ncbi:vWA domain-containing protein [Palleronia pelagia]|uniref:Ca-activated chloride channel family protein n=1 Tax=Palleronia pelagia TaxID=387096 RepID=A0A1H8H6T7_9RHOB|nr:vWA domain-containing protein [Palleronia pelagia]SEN51228.1 Ca-activated chloride channel family protein [Palleronia pelagia]